MSIMELMEYAKAFYINFITHSKNSMEVLGNILSFNFFY